jgi:glycosyltransferase involved in cell wall biosynthesis
MIDSPIYSVVIPVWNEGSHLKLSLATIQKTLESLGESYELILIDDGSTDDTWTIIVEESKGCPLLRAVRLSRNFGKESALCAGLEMARGAAVVVMDGDLQHPPPLVLEMARMWREAGVDVIEAVKKDRGSESFVSRIGATLFYTLVDGLSGRDLKGATDYKLMDRKVVDAWLKMKEHSLFFRGMTAWLGFRRKQIFFAVPERIGGQSKWSVFRQIRLAINGVTASSSLPLHFITFAGGVFLLFAVILGIQTLSQKIMGRAVSGFTTVILLLLIIGSLLMISLGVIGEYIARIYEEVKGRPRYVVAQVLDKTKSA